MGVIARLGDPEMHFWLTRSMARRLGVSLSEAMAEGALTQQDYAGMVTRCRTCSCTDACQLWLGTVPKPDETVPAFCMHADQFTVLRRQK